MEYIVTFHDRNISSPLGLFPEHFDVNKKMFLINVEGDINGMELFGGKVLQDHNGDYYLYKNDRRCVVNFQVPLKIEEYLRHVTEPITSKELALGQILLTRWEMTGAELLVSEVERVVQMAIIAIRAELT